MARNFDVFKVVEINNSAALRSGAVIAQQPLAKADIEASGKVVPVSKDGYLDNGFFFRLNNDGEVVVPADGNTASPMFMAYNEPILDLREDYGLLSDFAEKFDDETGLLTIGSLPTDYVGPQFSVLRSTLPDGETLALEVLVVAVA